MVFFQDEGCLLHLKHEGRYFVLLIIRCDDPCAERVTHRNEGLLGRHIATTVHQYDCDGYLLEVSDFPKPLIPVITVKF